MKLQKLTLISKYKLLILAFFLILIPNKVQAIVPQTKEFYVNDSANLISSKTEEYIISKSKELNDVDGTQIVVVTINDLEGMSIEEYATTLFREYGIGDKEKNNGLLLLLSLDGRKFRVEVGYGLEGILPDGKTGRFQDEYIIPYLKNNEWDKGIKNGYDAFFEEIVKQNHLDITHDKANTYTNNQNDLSFGAEEAYANILGFIALFIGLVMGRFIKNKFFSVIYIILLIIVWINLQIIENPIITICTIFHTIGFIFGTISQYGSGSGGSSYGGSGHYGGHSSSGGSFGGGGSSGGGGSTRGF